MTDEEMDRIENRLDFAERDGWDLLAALREERAARLKAEAERDEMQVGGRKAIETCARVIVERGEALALLSKAREAWARFAASDRLYHAYPCYHRVPVGGQTLPGAACTCGLADLAKILRTGETT